MKKLAIMSLLAAAATLSLAGIVSAGAPWSLFDDATAIKMPVKGNPWAIEVRSDTSTATPWGGVIYQEPDGVLSFGELYQLSTDYNVTDDDCGGGAPRFSIGIDMDGDGAADGNVFVYIGPMPNFTGCAPGWQSTGNLIGNPELRFDLTQVGGAWYDSYANALSLVGDKAVAYVALVVDAGWLFADGEQTVRVDNVMVNNHRLTAKGFSKK